MSKKFGSGAPKCPTCGQSVFFNEQVMALEKPWHARCLKCAQCSKTLEPGNFSDRGGKLIRTENRGFSSLTTLRQGLLQTLLWIRCRIKRLWLRSHQ